MTMYVGISKFRLPPGLDRAAVLADIQKTIPVYQGRDGLVRKYIAIDWERREGQGIYLWDDRVKAETFYAFARAKIREQTGAEPEITILEAPVIVDNALGSVEVAA
jgi:hypothetical protein